MAYEKNIHILKTIDNEVPLFKGASSQSIRPTSEHRSSMLFNKIGMVLIRDHFPLYGTILKKIKKTLDNGKIELRPKYKTCGNFFSKDNTSHLLRHMRSCSQNHNVDISNYMKLGKDQSCNLTAFSNNEEIVRS